MRRKKKKLNYLFWMPRLLSLTFIVLATLYAAHTLQSGINKDSLLIFFVELTPAYVIIAISIIAWHKEEIGGWAFIGLATLFSIYAFQVINFTNLTLFSSMSLISGILFLLDHHHRVLKNTSIHQKQIHKKKHN